MLRIVADVGNSRLKLGHVDPSGRLAEVVVLPTDERGAWESVWTRWNPEQAPSEWAIATVNPPAAMRLGSFLTGQGVASARWFRSAADVPIRHLLENPETAGADRALAVGAAVAAQPSGHPGLVVSCGTAITVERVSADGTWQGGAIAPSLAISARALHLLTAQLPLVAPGDTPPAWDRSTRPALEAGLFWSVVGGVRELLTRQSADLGARPWLVWTGGEAPRLAPSIEWDGARIAPDLVLEGLVRVAFPSSADHARA